MSTTTYAHCLHEARHVVACWFLAPGLRVERVAVGIHARAEGAMHSSRVAGKPGIADLVVSLAGWVGDPDLPAGAAWPEPWPPRPDAPDQVGALTRRLGLTQEQYEGTCALTEDLCREPHFVAATHLVARALQAAPRISAEGVEILRAAAGVPEHEGAITCNTWP
jgi:hypothetical protein